ncbi:tyrosine--tRNA ligase [Rheinheimera sp. 1928-s]|uniref:tyrosine--tRNA ligase n=1 Tax=Rheinheimera sp. 1928-s TaxID=3033803 RepID=UPI002637A0BD|nr:tyrosine--tRNA ligase [Rheinheimera sp. 1928-s]MDF3127255.1 tyrosine--tRNA ligase [Rheinheimera sp. 1928-s]
MTTTAVSKPQLVDDLLQRGLIAQCSNPELLRDFLSSRQSLYCGFDPTAGSLHIGHLVPLLMLKRFQDAGHHVIALIGGATGFIGDPSFKATERSLNDTKSIQAWTEQLGSQIIALLQPVLSEPLQLVNNADWLSTLDVISFFRDVGKHFSVNAMMRKESVRQRLERPDQGISFTEFSYSLLQAYDFAMLNQKFGCTLQIGGNDQWGNIVAGIDLCRRLNHTKVEGLTLPLITKADGSKFGKTESGTIWLDKNKTSPFSFYQFWLNTDDKEVYNLLRYYSFLSCDEITALEQTDRNSGSKPQAQRILAEQVTRFVHGEAGLISAERITKALFTGQPQQLSLAELQQLELDALHCVEIERSLTLSELVQKAGLASSKSKARDLLSSKAIRLNGEVMQLDMKMSDIKPLHHQYWLLQRGQKQFCLVKSAK